MDEARHERIRAVVASIPEGSWCSYGDVAARAGERSARLVGSVLAADGADLPWHRVLRTTGVPAPHIAVEQIRRLTFEGVPVVDARAPRSHRWAFEPPPRRTVLAGHETPSRPPITVAPGDRVTVGERDTDWPAFVFVTMAHGHGWVPERHLDGSRPEATVRTRYDTQELAVDAGQVVDGLVDDAESGWTWCRDAAGREGWLPHRVLDAG